MSRIILATTSPHRQAAFRLLGLDFVMEGSKVNEYTDDRPKDPKELVQYLAKLKAGAVAKNHKEGIVLGFDTVGIFESRIMEKPRSREEARKRLDSLSGKMHLLITGVHLINAATGESASGTDTTKIFMRKLTETEVENHLDKDTTCLTRAIGYNPIGPHGIAFIERIKGSYTNVIWGIPLEVVVEMLREVAHD